jgi:hypothetical protein
MTYGNEIIKPARIDVHISAENCPAIVRFWMIIGRASLQNDVSTPINCPALQSKLYVGKLISNGAKIISLNKDLLNINAIVPTSTIDNVALIKCHLNSSRWSRKDISLTSFSII